MNLSAVIVAGGQGTRLGSVAGGLPKALVPIGGRPLIDHSFSLLSRYGFAEVVICLGYLGDQIRAYVQDGAKWNIRVRYSEETVPLGTAGCLRAIEPALSHDFLVLYCDVLAEIDLASLATAHSRSGADATLVVHPNNHPYDSDLVEVDSATNQIRTIHRKPHSARAWLSNLVNASLYVLSPGMLELIPAGEKADCAHDLFPKALGAGLRLLAYRTAEYLKDIGTPDRLQEAEEDFRSGRVAASNRDRPRPAVFLDRDGVVIQEVGHIHHPEQMVLVPGAVEAIRRLNNAGLLTVIVTNQPAVARGLCDLATIGLIHRKLETLLGARGAFVDSIRFCPHHPDRGFEGENPTFKIPCECRKPKTGMVKAAQQEMNIDLSHSFLVGDSTTDLQTGKNAGVTTVLVQTGYGGKDGKFPALPNHTSPNLNAAVDWILAQRNGRS